ncbi:MAG: M1 family metallopeptidase [Saprospiraceae bacterium]|nr:M1 family metallopeptidase [Saprospiraceae bacterium]
MKSILSIFLFSFSFIVSVNAQDRSNHGNKFEQLDQMFASPNTYRNADGAPGPEYWQQQVDYKIKCALDVKEQRLDGTEIVTYHNNSPSTHRYLWLQLDENEHAADAQKHRQDPSSISEAMSRDELRRLEAWRELEKYGVNILKVTDTNGNDLNYMINGTVMRLDLPKPLLPGEQFSFEIDWNYYLINRMNSTSWGRGGYEFFEDHDNYLYTIVQWFPRLCVYSDFEGWQNKQFVGRGEFAVNFGNYDVEITVPADHMVGSTGECQNYNAVLTPTQLERWEQAQSATEPLEIVTLDEAKANEKTPVSSEMKTWRFKAENVRDFAWTASKKFVWDAMPHMNADGMKVMCMSYYGKEAYPIYRKYSTKSVEHTLATYSKYTIPYPYPVAISVEAANGMEYPMICFNPGRAEEDGTYTERAKYAAILVIIHEVGHNYFPMIINSDERQWAWFDEGINSFMQFIAEQEFDNNYPSGGGAAHTIIDYMARPKDQLEPIMTNSENIIDYGNNAYSKPAAALNILRETILGRELFDFAFQEYARRWAFKHPTPEDFFRTMEEASGVDLDWFWRGWFYSIDAVDISLDSIKWYKVDLENDPTPRIDSTKQVREKPYEHITKKRYKESGLEFAVDKDPDLVDFYSNYKPWETEDSVTYNERIIADKLFTEEEKRERYGNNNYYELHFSNKGGLVMPVIIEWAFADGTKEVERIPVDIWRKNEFNFKKVFVKDKEVTAIVIDPYRETADIDESNNNWPVRELPDRFQVFKESKMKEKDNPMQKAKKKVIRP